jgi:6-phosphogluconolactonase
MDQRELHVLPNLDALSEAAARYVTELARRAIEQRGRFTLALAGGSTPRRMYQLLAGPGWRDRIAWGQWHFFLSDERLVPPTDQHSNFHMAEEALLAHVPISASQIHRVPTELGDPATVADRYAAEIRSFFEPSASERPHFDLVLLGMGADGHTASLFPGKPALEEAERLVVASPPGVLPPPVDRITFTFPLLNAARAVAFLVAGADKQPALQAVREGLPFGDMGAPPAARVRPTNGELRWFVDADAAGQQG